MRCDWAQWFFLLNISQKKIYCKNRSHEETTLPAIKKDLRLPVVDLFVHPMTCLLETSQRTTETKLGLRQARPDSAPRWTNDTPIRSCEDIWTLLWPFHCALDNATFNTVSHLLSGAGSSQVKNCNIKDQYEANGFVSIIGQGPWIHLAEAQINLFSGSILVFFIDNGTPSHHWMHNSRFICGENYWMNENNTMVTNTAPCTHSQRLDSYK